MTFLAEAINLPVIPDKERQHYLNLVIEQANSMQKSLEESAKQDRSGKMSSIIRNHKINSFLNKGEQHIDIPFEMWNLINIWRIFSSF